MLPMHRTENNLYSIPKFSIEKGDVLSFIEELKGFHEEFRDCFSRSEPRENFFQYMVGQFSELERKSIEPIALNVEDAKVRSMQRFISDVMWDEKNNKATLKRCTTFSILIYIFILTKILTRLFYSNNWLRLRSFDYLYLPLLLFLLLKMLLSSVQHLLNT